MMPTTHRVSISKTGPKKGWLPWELLVDGYVVSRHSSRTAAVSAIYKMFWVVVPLGKSGNGRSHIYDARESMKSKRRPTKMKTAYKKAKELRGMELQAEKASREMDHSFIRVARVPMQMTVLLNGKRAEL